jgi:nucleoside-diphosphate-sugar epimerase
VNIGNPAEMTVLDFAREVIRATGSTSEVVFEELPVDDPKVRQPDIALAREKLGWEPKVPLAQGLKTTVDFFAASLD